MVDLHHEVVFLDRLVEGVGYLYGAQVRETTAGQLRSFGSFDEPFSYAAILLLGLVVAHIMALHEVGSNNPDGIEIITGDAFTDTMLAKRTDLSEYRIVHFATHGVINAQHPELSGIILSMLNQRGERFVKEQEGCRDAAPPVIRMDDEL